jgi:hypothetical protein
MSAKPQTIDEYLRNSSDVSSRDRLLYNWAC